MLPQTKNPPADFSYILHFKSAKIAKFAKIAKIAKFAKIAKICKNCKNSFAVFVTCPWV
jgi:hypothetical protein